MRPEEMERIGEYAARLRRSAGYLLVLDPEKRRDMRETLRKWWVDNGLPLEELEPGDAGNGR